MDRAKGGDIFEAVWTEVFFPDVWQFETCIANNGEIDDVKVWTICLRVDNAKQFHTSGLGMYG